MRRAVWARTQHLRIKVAAKVSDRSAECALALGSLCLSARWVARPGRYEAVRETIRETRRPPERQI